ncbi:MAG: Fic family protein [Bacteroidetes bacterium]|nr:Fic family protein [Bacteroidota bacterium]
MILYELFRNEDNPVYKELSLSNYSRQLDFLKHLVTIAPKSGNVFLSQTVLKALNYHAMACLHDYAGQYRPHMVEIRNRRNIVTYTPPEHFRVNTLMDDFVNRINRMWEQTEPFELAALVLWKLNWIHPFVNGNGRTARAACYFVLCLKAGGWLAGKPILPDRLRRDSRYVPFLIEADNGDIKPLTMLVKDLTYQQLLSAQQ